MKIGTVSRAAIEAGRCVLLPRRYLDRCIHCGAQRGGETKRLWVSQHDSQGRCFKWAMVREYRGTTFEMEGDKCS